ncbi:MAG: hypothetical protein H5T83_12250 [Actinotalea sp.]|nr:hypothetical protein [Actinotalea sp.]
MAAGPVAASAAVTRVVLAAGGGDDGLRPDLEPMDVTPGVVGFAVTALVVAGLIGLLLSMVVKLRRVNLGAERPAPPWADPEQDGTAGEGVADADDGDRPRTRGAGPDGAEPDGAEPDGGSAGPPGGGR